MIVVRVELHNANTGEVSEIGRVVIANDGTGTRDMGHYDVKLARDGQTDNGVVWARPLRIGRVVGHARAIGGRLTPVWSLVVQALHAVGYGE